MHSGFKTLIIGILMALSGCSLRLAPQLDPFYSAVLLEYPHHAEALYGQGNFLVRQGRYHEAIPYFEKLVRLDSGHYRARLVLGQCRLELNQFGKAETAFRSAITLNPCLEAHMGLANALVFQGKLERAKEMAGKIKSTHGESALLFRLLGDIAFMEQRLVEAVKYYKQSLSISSTQKGVQDRLRDLEEILTVNPESF